MRSREDAHSLTRPRALAVGTLAAALIALSGCGEDDFKNEDRPPAPIELTAAIDSRSVTVSPGEFGAGLVNITISNQTDDTVNLVLDGPTPAESGDIPPGGTGSIKAALEEGDYEAAAGAEVDIDSAELIVGPERESSQNDLLLP